MELYDIIQYVYNLSDLIIYHLIKFASPYFLISRLMRGYSKNPETWIYHHSLLDYLGNTSTNCHTCDQCISN